MVARRLALLVLAALGLGAVGLPSARASGPPKLYGTVGPGYTITLKRNGKLVRTLPPGRYRVIVTDRATNHDFTLEGSGIDTTVITGDGFTGTKAVTLRLPRGTYTYYCALHEPVMFHRFTVK